MSQITPRRQKDKTLCALLHSIQDEISKKLKASKIRKRLKGTAIVDTEAGILLVSTNSDRFSLPGGGAEKQETGEAAAIRELKEETGLKAISAVYLFSHIGGIRKRGFGLVRNHHRVFLIQTKGQPRPEQEIQAIRYYRPGDEINLSSSARTIIEKYWAIKQNERLDLQSSHPEVVAAQELHSL
ncbi:MAG TPA: NUDIX domain-containing protein [Coleofasciculaceae cyanobacterium]